MSLEEFATEVVGRLQSAGFQALWAGGCVRDRLLGETPKDFDVATSATPDQVRQLFGRRRTLSIGEAFGVIVVFSPGHAHQIDVATFRRDATYSDGRHPDGVTFSSAEEDAHRRDFTINGLFFDPIRRTILDYVGGQEDLQGRRVRAIGDARARFEEDKLRMLRAVRFAANLDFELDAATLGAIQSQPEQIQVVSAERIAMELRRMLTGAHRGRALQLLRLSGLLDQLLPEAACRGSRARLDETPWDTTARILDELHEPRFAQALAALLRLVVRDVPDGAVQVAVICRRWKLTNDEQRMATWLLQHADTIRHARRTPWPQLQRILVHASSRDLIDYAAALVRVLDSDDTHIEFCRAQLGRPADELNPPPLMTGNDLRQRGIPPGAIYKSLLSAVRDAQLNEQITTQGEAWQLVERMLAEQK